MQQIANGVVIKAKVIGDDRLLTLLTAESGVITAYAKGAGKPRAKLTSTTELFCYCKFSLFRYRESITINSADIEQSFFSLRENLEALTLASYIAELFCDFSPIEESAEEYLRLLLNTLHFLSKSSKPAQLIKAVCELRLVTMAGFMPNLIACSQCHEFKEDEMFFSVENSAIYCKDCYSKEQGNAVLVSYSTVVAMRHIIFSPFEKIFSFTLSQTNLKELNLITEQYTKFHAGHGYRSLQFYYSVLS